jgi:hypothetical protein
VFLGLVIWYYYVGVQGNIKMFRKIVNILMVIAMILIFIAPIYYMIFWTLEINELTDGMFDGFIGSDSEDGDVASWGPGAGWILTFVCFTLIIFTLMYTKQGCEEVKTMTAQMSPTNVKQSPPQYRKI